MRSVDVLQLALTGLRQNKLRSGLTALGVTVGVFALTTIISLGQGLQATIIDQLTDDESQTRLMLRPGFGPMEERKAEIVGVTDAAKIDRLRKSIAKRRRGGPAQMKRTLLTVSALKAIGEREHVTSIRPLALDRFKLVCGEHVVEAALSYGVDGADWNDRVVAGQPVTKDAHGVWLHEYLLYRWGYKTDEQIAELLGKTVVVSRDGEAGGLNSMLAGLQASGVELPAGSEQMAEEWLKRFAAASGDPNAKLSKNGALSLELPLLGVIRERIESDGFEVWEDSFSMQSDMFLPQALAEELFELVPTNQARGYNAASIEIDDAKNLPAVEKALKAEGFRPMSINTILKQVERTMAIITAVVSGLTAIALIVAVLGIVNTMVMNVSERTKEIGILKALGARDSQVLTLFLFESGLIGLAGGGAGIALALLVSIPGDYLNRMAIMEATQYGFDGSVFAYPPWLLSLAMAFALILSVLAALGPATRASRVDPVAALRDE